jgi:DNA-binding response OmpR family regulator
VANLVKNPAGRPWRILTVDDQDSMRAAVQRVLTFEKIDVTVAASGSRALELLASDDFDLVLLDVNMPDVDGFSVLEKLRKTSRLADLEVIMVTGMVDQRSVLKGKEHGVSEYLVKPYKIVDLLARVDRCLLRLVGKQPA